jgi:hypothetical protein
LEGDKVLINPLVSNEPSYDENELENTEVFTVCVVTRAMRKICEEEETLFQDGSTGTSEVELNTHFLLMPIITFYMAIAISLDILQTWTKNAV